MNFYEQIVQNIIRPARQKYKISKLGSPKFQIPSKLVNNKLLYIEREDFIILNRYKKKIHTSFYNINNPELKSQALPCIVYLHANNGSRNQGICYLQPIIQNEISLLLFDCSGSGLSDGDYITLGVMEAEDLEYIVQYLIKYKKVKNIGLWGRSMGAVTCLLYASKNIRQIKSCIYDSPFSSLQKLIKQLAKKKTGIPQFFFTPLMGTIESMLKQKINVNLDQLNIVSQIQSIRCPGMFITSTKDNLVNCDHTKNLYDAYKAEKKIQYIDSQHHQIRSHQLVQRCICFMIDKFQKKKIFGLNIYPVKSNSMRDKIGESDRSLVQVISQKQLNHQLSQKKTKQSYTSYNCFFQNLCVKQIPVQQQFTFDTTKRISIVDIKSKDEQRLSIQRHKVNRNSETISPKIINNHTNSIQKLNTILKPQYKINKNMIPYYFDQNQIGIRRVIPVRRQR